MTIKVICLDDRNKPEAIPAEKWVEFGVWYTLTFFAFCKPQEIQGVSLYEKPLCNCGSYKYFRASRFGVRPEDWERFVEFVKMHTDMDDVDVDKLIEESLDELPQLVEA